MTRKPLPANALIWARHRCQESGKPCSSSTGGPSPAVATFSRTPPESTDVSATSVLVWETTALSLPAAGVVDERLALTVGGKGGNGALPQHILLHFDTAQV